MIKIARGHPRRHPRRARVVLPALAATILLGGCTFSSPPPPSKQSIAAPTPSSTTGGVRCEQESRPQPDTGAEAPISPPQQPASQSDLLSIPETTPDRYGTSLTSYWGPARPSYTFCRTSTVPVLNSIEDDVNQLWEKSFLALDTRSLTDAHPEAAASDEWTWDRLHAANDSVYLADVHFWNDVSPSLADQWTRGTTIRLDLPSGLTRQAHLVANLSAENAVPPRVFAAVVIDAPSQADTYEVSLVPGSAYVYTGATSYAVSTDDLTSEQGALIGCTGPDGVLTGADDCQGHLQVQVKVSTPRFTARVYSPQSVSSKVDATPQETLEIMTTIDNTSAEPEGDSHFTVDLPPGLTYVDGSAQTSMFQESGANDPWRPATLGDAASPSHFSVDVDDEIPPGGRLDLSYRVVVGDSACRGAWAPIRSTMRQSTVSVQKELLINVIATC